jgi:hypothetical protein
LKINYEIRKIRRETIMKKINAKVVGVMFNNRNRDGGRNRQDILKEIFEQRGADVLLGAHYMERTNGEGEAVCLYDVETKQIIGWLSTEDSKVINKRNHAKFYLGHIAYHGCYHVTVESISEKKALELREAA